SPLHLLLLRQPRKRLTSRLRVKPMAVLLRPHPPRHPQKRPKNRRRPQPAMSLLRPHHHRLQRRRCLAGLAFAAQVATARYAARRSRPIGGHRRRSRYGAARSDRVGRHSQSAATAFTRKSSVATTRSLPVMTWPPANQYGGTATRLGFGNRTPARDRAGRPPS